MMDNDKRLKWISNCKSKSSNDRLPYEDRWVRNIKLSKGIPLEDKNTRSEIRNRNKIYFRKVWSVCWRLVAAFNNAFLRDAESFKVTGVDTTDDPRKSAVLLEMMRYRHRQMMRKDSLFIKHIWSFFDIVNLGWCAGKLCWEYSDGSDRPRYISYPTEQVYPDFTADTKSDMKYCIFVNYLTYDEMEEKEYKNLDKAKKVGVTNAVRSARNAGSTDPIQNPGNNEYASSGRYAENGGEEDRSGLYEIWESFYKEKGKWKLAITHAGDAFAKDPIDSPYGDWLPLVMGVCLTEPHKLIGEGFPQSMEGPQESYNFNLNMRKDNIALALNKPTFVSRYGNVDLNALANRGPGKAVLTDDINQAVKEMDVQDVTQSSYAESQQDMGMMEDVSGVTAAVNGMGNSDTATETQINLSQGTAKLDLYTGIVGEVYFTDFVAGLGYLIQRFETDEKIFKICQGKLEVETGIIHSDVYDLDFEADYEISAGINVGKESELRQSFLVLDRGAMYNQTQTTLLQMGAVPPDGVKMFNSSAVFEDILKIVGKKDFAKYFVMIPPPPQAQTPGQKLASAMPADNGALAGMAAPQPGAMANMQPPNELQGGSAGGL